MVEMEVSICATPTPVQKRHVAIWPTGMEWEQPTLPPEIETPSPTPLPQLPVTKYIPMPHPLGEDDEMEWYDYVNPLAWIFQYSNQWPLYLTIGFVSSKASTHKE